MVGAKTSAETAIGGFAGAGDGDGSGARDSAEWTLGVADSLWGDGAVFCWAGEVCSLVTPFWSTVAAVAGAVVETGAVGETVCSLASNPCSG